MPVLKSGTLLREIRRSRALSQRDLARTAEVAQSTIHRLEDGTIREIDLDIAVRLTRGLSVDFGLLFSMP